MANSGEVRGSNAMADTRNRVITIEATTRPEEIAVRVAAYCRVSTDSLDQMNSFAAQMKYYMELITGKSNWKLVDIYADPGVTGTSAKKRKDFQRLLTDCRRGKIDRVLVKSISRFARNTKECLEIVRELKAIGVAVVFEEQHIDTGAVSGEFLTSVFAAIAQKESESTSARCSWGYQFRMQNGLFNTYHAPYGFPAEGRGTGNLRRRSCSGPGDILQLPLRRPAEGNREGAENGRTLPRHMEQEDRRVHPEKRTVCGQRPSAEKIHNRHASAPAAKKSWRESDVLC